MDDNLITLIALVATLLIGSIAAGVWLRLRSLLRNLAELFIAIDNCLTDDCTADEIKVIIKEGQESVADGLGFWSALITVFKR